MNTPALRRDVEGTNGIVIVFYVTFLRFNAVILVLLFVIKPSYMQHCYHGALFRGNDCLFYVIHVQLR